MLKNKRILAIIATSVFLVSCSNSNNSDLQKYIADLKKQTTKEAERIENHFPLRKEPTDNSIINRNPFPQKSMANATTQMNRAPLERYPIEELHLLGTVQQSGSNSAIISTPDGKVYQVSIGNIIGTQQGQITSISEYEVDVAEPANISTGSAAHNIALRLKDQ